MGRSRRSDRGVVCETGKCESGINLGGIGTGGVEIWPDGRLYFWNMVNSRPWAKSEKETNVDGVKGSHSINPVEPAVMDTDWFIRIAEKGKRPVYRWLFTGHGYALGTASHFWRVHKYFFMISIISSSYLGFVGMFHGSWEPWPPTSISGQKHENWSQRANASRFLKV